MMSRFPTKPIGLMSVREKCTGAELRLTCQQNSPVIFAWVYYIATAFMECGEVVLQHAGKESNSNSASFHVFSLSVRENTPTGSALTLSFL